MRLRASVVSGIHNGETEMAELPENTVAFLASIGCSTDRVADDAWLIVDPKTEHDGGRPMLNGATIDSATKFPLPGSWS